MNFDQYKSLLVIANAPWVDDDFKEVVNNLYKPNMPLLRKHFNRIKHRVNSSTIPLTCVEVIKKEKIPHHLSGFSNHEFKLTSNNTCELGGNLITFVFREGLKFNEKDEETVWALAIEQKLYDVTDQNLMASLVVSYLMRSVGLTEKVKMGCFLLDVESFIDDINHSKIDRILSILEESRKGSIKISSDDENRLLFLRDCHISMELGIINSKVDHLLLK